MDESAEATLREISERNDIIKRIHRCLTEQKTDRATSSWVLVGENITDPVIGRHEFLLSVRLVTVRWPDLRPLFQGTRTIVLSIIMYSLS